MATSAPPTNRFPRAAKLLGAISLCGCCAATCQHQPISLPPILSAPEPDPADEPEPPRAQAGPVLQGRYHDGSYPFSMAVQEGWVAHPGSADAPLRVVLEHVPTGSSLEVWVFHESPTAPRPRAGCAWSFADEGSYEQLRSAEARHVATCVPVEAGQQLVLGTYMVRSALAYHFELLVPSGRLLQARRAAEELMLGVEIY